MDVRSDLPKSGPKKNKSGEVIIVALLVSWLVAMAVVLAELILAYSVTRYTFILRDGSKVKISGNRGLAALEPEISKRLIPHIADDVRARLEAGEKIWLHPTVSYSKDGIEGIKSLGRRRGATQKPFSIPWCDFTGTITQDGWVGLTANHKTVVSLPQGELSNLMAFGSIARRVLREGLFVQRP